MSKRYISFGDYLQANAPDKEPIARAIVKEWIGNNQSGAQLAQQLEAALGEHWLVYKTLQRITQ